MAATLHAVSPLSVLSRGYAIAWKRTNGRKRILRDSNQVAIGDAIDVNLKKGLLSCTVEGKSLGLEQLTTTGSARRPGEEEDKKLARK